MNKIRAGALGIFSVLIMSMLLSSVEAESIVRTPYSSESAPLYTVYEQSIPSCSTIASSYASYTECQRTMPYGYGYGRTPRAESSYSASRKYAESPGFERYPQESVRMNKNAQLASANFDTSSSAYDYRGPMYERRIISSDDFVHDVSAKTGFFNSRSQDLTTRSIRNEVIEKYVGATESRFGESRNNRVATQSAGDTSARDFDAGFSFGKQRLFDESEFARDSYSGLYYYRPIWGAGLYNWRY